MRVSLNGNTASNIEGFVAVDAKRHLIVVSFRGSHSIRNWITNLQFEQDACDLVSDCEVHAGFMSAWKDVQATVTSAAQSLKAANPSYAVIVTGHSLGGAVATLAAAYLRKAGLPCDLYTYGSPRVGNEAFVSFVTNQPGAEYRLTHLDDPVPRLPPLIFSYRHTSPEYWMFDQTATTTTYGPGDIKACLGSANVDCNASMSGLDINAHLYYFEHISGCGGSMGVKRSEANDTALEQRLNEYAAKDREYAASLASQGS